MPSTFLPSRGPSRYAFLARFSGWHSVTLGVRCHGSTRCRRRLLSLVRQESDPVPQPTQVCAHGRLRRPARRRCRVRHSLAAASHPHPDDATHLTTGRILSPRLPCRCPQRQWPAARPVHRGARLGPGSRPRRRLGHLPGPKHEIETFWCPVSGRSMMSLNCRTSAQPGALNHRLRWLVVTTPLAQVARSGADPTGTAGRAGRFTSACAPGQCRAPSTPRLTIAEDPSSQRPALAGYACAT